MEASQASQFPRFSDGDVQVVVGPSQLYQLHSTILRRASPFFAQLLDCEPATELCAPARKAGRSVRYRFELAKPVTPGSGGVGIFQRTVGSPSRYHPEPANTLCLFSRASINGENLHLGLFAFRILIMARFPMNKTSTGTGSLEFFTTNLPNSITRILLQH